jgi:hypothetical protein
MTKSFNSHADRPAWRPAAIDHAQSDEAAPIPHHSAPNKPAFTPAAPERIRFLKDGSMNPDGFVAVDSTEA